MVKLKEEEKKTKEFFEKFVNKNSLLKPSKRKILDYCNQYVLSVLKNTKYANEKIIILEENNPNNAGSMLTAENGQESQLRINLDNLLSDKRLASKSQMDRFKAGVSLQNTLNHEIKHYFQKKEIENFRISTNGMTISECMNIAQEDIAKKTDLDKFYSVDEGNYADTYIEGDARRAGALKTAIQLFRIYPNLSEKKKEYLVKKVIKSIEEDNVEFNKLRYDSSSKKYNRYDVTTAYVDEYISAKPKMLENPKYRLLNLEYDKDGTRFSFHEVVKRRNTEVEALVNNSSLTDKVRKNLYRQVSSAFAQVEYNCLIRAEEKQIVELRRRMGDDAFLDELDFVIKGKKSDINEQFEKYKQYSEFFEENKNRISEKLKGDALDALSHVYEKSNFSIKIDEKTRKKKVDFDMHEINYLNKIKNDVEKTKYLYPEYTTKDEYIKSDKKIREEKESYKNGMIDRFAQRRFDQIKKKEEEDKKRKLEALKEHRRKMKNPLYKLAYNIRKRMENGNKKQLPSANDSFSKTVLEEKREKVQDLEKTRDDLKYRFDNIKKEAEEILSKAENRVFLSREEKQVEEEEIGKQI